MTLRQANKSLYWAWKSMKQRCQNPKCQAYRNYGARGVTVCEEWQQFEPFLDWALKNGYAKGLELDRKDNDGNYEPSNCRWIPRRENINNRRNTITINVDGLTLPETEWAERLGVDRALLKMWLNNHGPGYTSARIKDILENGYKPRDFGYSHRKPVRHVESGQVFPSGREAARHFGIGNGTIAKSIQKGKSTHVGTFVFQRDEIEETIVTE